MATAPYGVRLLVGAATMAVEETIRLPKTILMYPMTLASTAAHIVMRFQQNVAELVIKGDATLEHIFPPKDEQPEWATFDEDLPDDDDDDASAPDLERRTEKGRFTLYPSLMGPRPRLIPRQGQPQSRRSRRCLPPRWSRSWT